MRSSSGRALTHGLTVDTLHPSETEFALHFFGGYHALQAQSSMDTNQLEQDPINDLNGSSQSFDPSWGTSARIVIMRVPRF